MNKRGALALSIIIIVVVLVIGIGIGAYYFSDFSTIPDNSIDREEVECKINGGSWDENIGSEGSRGFFCNEATSDGGMECTDSDQCESNCIAPEGVNDGDLITGTCNNREALLSSTYLVESGKASLLIIE